MSTYLDNFRLSAAMVGVFVQQLGVPKESFATPPWMSRRFAELLIQCRSLDDAVGLVADNLRDAAAFVITATFWLGEIERGEAQLPSIPTFEAPEITAAGHAILGFLDEMERIYPEGLTEIPDEQSTRNT